MRNPLLVPLCPPRCAVWERVTRCTGGHTPPASAVCHNSPRHLPGPGRATGRRLQVDTSHWKKALFFCAFPCVQRPEGRHSCQSLSPQLWPVQSCTSCLGGLGAAIFGYHQHHSLLCSQVKWALTILQESKNLWHNLPKTRNLKFLSVAVVSADLGIFSMIFILLLGGFLVGFFFPVGFGTDPNAQIASRCCRIFTAEHNIIIRVHRMLSVSLQVHSMGFSILASVVYGSQYSHQ